MLKKTATVTILLIWGSFWCQGQNLKPTGHQHPDWTSPYYLVLDKPGKISRLRFYPGMLLRFKINNDKRIYEGRIEAIRKRSVVIFNTELPLHDIREIRVTQQAPTGKFLSGLGSGIRGVGSLFTLIGTGNYLLTQDKENGRITALAGLTALGVGQLFRGFNRRTYKINKNRQLKTIQII